LKQLARRFLETVAPRKFATLQAIRARRRIARLQRQWGRVALAKRFIEAHGEIVCGGPFARMKLPYEECFAGYLAMMVGSLERELEPAIMAAINRNYSRILNIGCAEGYYAVGFAIKSKAASVHAYDIDPWARRYCTRLAALNGAADRVQVRGWCDHAAITAVARESTLILCACEGYEFELLDPVKCPLLNQCDLIVEMHDFARSGGVTAPILARFRDTHNCTIVEIQPRDAFMYPALEALPESARQEAVAEVRNPNSRWAVILHRP